MRLVFLLGLMSTTLVTMRVFPFARGGLAAATSVLMCLTMTTVANADENAGGSQIATAASMQIELVKSRQTINNLYAAAAAASERLNGAQYHLGFAKANVAAQRSQAKKASRAVAKERESVAALTVQDLQSNNSVSRIASLFDSAGPSQLLDRSNAYDSTREGLQARIAALNAREVVYDAARKRADDAVAQQQSAIRDSRNAKETIESSIASAEAAARQAREQRPTLLRKLAKAQNLPVAVVTKRQESIDTELDAQPAAPERDRPGQAEPGQVEPAKPPKTDRPDPKPEPKPKPKPKPPAQPDPPPAPSGSVESAISFAMAQLGEPYAWGGTGPNSWDCSGLTMRAFQAAGRSLPHFAGAQYTGTKRVSVSNIRRGDLLFWSDGSSASIYHVAIYLGGNKMIHAPRTGRNVEIVPLSYWISPDLASRVG